MYLKFLWILAFTTFLHFLKKIHHVKKSIYIFFFLKTPLSLNNSIYNIFTFSQENTPCKKKKKRVKKKKLPKSQ